ncbi:carbohydrate ABC transporter permease [Paenibacillus sp. IB182496]|uniref:Carbohydrate ABC transporter permease n=1 Tax=Paenibacillus sabuli TaxID=2772509 RepID=A0A927GUJ5_9BACL|nr:carbohydrate ABC transporter permease [Paenibacillus sabuli]MBD2847772.1 carbohydrate ABC transporter permease [Paenibacillus sabuli]
MVSRSRRMRSWPLYLFLLLCAAVTVFPLVNVLAVSLSSSRAIIAGEVGLWPVERNVAAYERLFRDGQLLVALKNTVVITLIGTLLHMVATTPAAYSLAKRRLRGRPLFTFMVLFSMLFGTGLIPLFLLVKQLHLINTFWAVWLPGLVSAYNLFVMKSFFEGMPPELEESAAMDGASDLTVFLRLTLPLSKAILAAISLFYAVALWNTYANALYFISKSELLPVTVKLYQMLQTPLDALLGGGDAALYIQPEGLKAAAIMITVAPILCVYPFLQKHFVKGVLIGSVKG